MAALCVLPAASQVLCRTFMATAAAQLLEDPPARIQHHEETKTLPELCPPGQELPNPLLGLKFSQDPGPIFRCHFRIGIGRVWERPARKVTPARGVRKGTAASTLGALVFAIVTGTALRGQRPHELLLLAFFVRWRA